MQVLSNRKLAQKIRSICAESGPRRFAVAFWGKNIPAKLFPNGTKNVEIILDVAMRGTTKDALEALGVPNASNVWVVDGLHAKLWISNSGALIGSANASANALGGDLNGGKLQELGVWIDAKADRIGYRAACAEFERLKSAAHLADSKDLERATNSMPQHMTWNSTKNSGNSLLNLVEGRPEDFGNTLFVFGDMRVSNEDQKACDVAYSEWNESIGGMNNQTLIAYSAKGPELAFEAAALVAMYWIENNAAKLCAYTDVVKIPAPENGKKAVAFYGRRNWSSFKRIAKIPSLGRIRDVETTDQKRAICLAGSELHGKRWKEYTAFQIAEALAEY